MTTEYAIGVDLGGTNTRAALVTKSGEIIEILRQKTPVSQGPQATAALIAKMSLELNALAPANTKVLGIGIGSPGPLSRAERMIFQTPNLPGFDGFALGAEVERASGLKTFLDNDAKCAARGERAFGAAVGLEHFVLLTLGTGIGGGVICNGAMLYGKGDAACELGHLTLYPDGRKCKCGNHGCFEEYASATAIERRASAAKGSPVNAIELLQAVNKSETWAVDCLKEICRDLAIGCASLVNIFDPQAIILGGGIFSSGGGPICEWVHAEIKDRCFKSAQKNLKILPSTLSGNAGVLGAASLVF